jgi:hypothetical protein
MSQIALDSSVSSECDESELPPMRGTIQKECSMKKTTKATATLPITFSDQEMLVYETLRARYQEDADRFTNAERARLLFLRWLYQEGRMDTPPAGRKVGKKRARVVQAIDEPVAPDGDQQ